MELPEILFEDNHLVIVNKSAGQIVQGDKTGDTPLAELVSAYIAQKYHKPGKAFIGVIHRIDRPVSGVVVFAKTGKALSRMNERFRKREVKKVYWALVEGKPEADSGLMVHYMTKNQDKNKSFARSTPAEGYLRCELSWKAILKLENYTLMEIEPLTGRHHQIRVQLSASGLPIKGDVKYGARRANSDRSVCLHARRISFQHPVSQDQIISVAPLPHTDAWRPLSASQDFF